MADNPVEPDQDEVFEDALQFLLDSDEFLSDSDEVRLDSNKLSLGRPKKYNCSECGEGKAEKKTVNGKTVSIPHCCPALLKRVQEWTKKHDMNPSHERLKMLLEQFEGRKDAEPNADQSKKSRGPYNCGSCGFPKKWPKPCMCKRNARLKRRNERLKRRRY
jgi:hypothetical protein